MIIIGIDPDLHNTGIAGYCTKNNTVTFVDVLRVRKSASGRGTTGRKAVLAMCNQAGNIPLDEDCVVVEGQEIAYTSKSGANPRDIMLLATVAGGFLAKAWADDARHVLFPPPNEWKGSVPKHTHQARIYDKLYWEFKKTGTSKTSYAYPTKGHEDVHGASTLNKGDWKHVGDAIGLAMWGALQMEKRK